MDLDSADAVRRKRYAIRRGMVKKASRSGDLLATERMLNSSLWVVLIDSLWQAESEARAGTNVEHYRNVRKAYECAQELQMRGTQLELLP